jgi:maltokinase
MHPSNVPEGRPCEGIGVDSTRQLQLPAMPWGDRDSAALLTGLRQRSPLPPGWAARVGALPPRVTGERAITVDQTNDSVVIGERVIVKWIRELSDVAHPAPNALEHLSAVGFAEVPLSYGIITWRSPRGYWLPVAFAGEYLAGARDGWQWCVDLVRHLGGNDQSDSWAVDFPARLGALTARLHLALATPSQVFASPAQTAGEQDVQRWHRAALDLLARAEATADAQTRAVLLPRLSTIIERLGPFTAAAGTAIQPTHGDLHVGQILRWDGGLAIVDFDGNPVVEAADITRQPVERDVAQLLCSLDHVGRIVLHRFPETPADLVHRWILDSQQEFLAAYHHSWVSAGCREALDGSLLDAMKVEQELRELVYAATHLPRWRYAPLAALRDLVPER